MPGCRRFRQNSSTVARISEWGKSSDRRLTSRTIVISSCSSVQMSLPRPCWARVIAKMVGGIVKATIAHIVQSSHEAVRFSEVKSEIILAAKTIRASTPGMTPPAMTAARLSRGGAGLHNVMDAFWVSSLDQPVHCLHQGVGYVLSWSRTLQFSVTHTKIFWFRGAFVHKHV